MAERQSVVLGLGELRRLVELSGLEPTARSPLSAAAGAAPTTESDAAMREHGLLGDSWAAALRTLADPVQEVRVVIPTPEECVYNVFYRGPAGDGALVGCWSDGGGVRLSHPWTPADLGRLAGEAAWADLAAPASPFRATMSPGALFAWAAAVDALRMVMFGSLLHRQPGIDLTLTLATVEEQFALGVANSDARWLVTLLRLLAPAGLTVDREAFRRGLAEIAGLGLLKEMLPNAWRPADVLQQFAAWLKNPLPAVAVESTRSDGAGGGDYRYAIALRGDGPLWVLDFSGITAGRPQVALGSVAADALRRHVADLVAPAAPGAARPDESPPRSTPATCKACGAALKPGKAFCTQCGAPAESENSP